MSHSIEVVSELNRKVSVVISAEEVNAGITAAAKEVGASVSLPGSSPARAGMACGKLRTEDFPVRTTSSALAYRAKLC